MNKEKIKYNIKFMSKIKDLFTNLFCRRLNMKENIEIKEECNDIKKNTFRENIEIKQGEEELRIIKLQNDYKTGNIKEEDMTDEESKKLIDLYKRQNKELQDKIYEKKNTIRRKLDNLIS